MTEYRLQGGCRCKQVTLEVVLTAEAGGYRPRACDCGFCQSHAAAYVSDPQGSVLIRIGSGSNLKTIRQGDQLAEFLCCPECGVLLGARWHDGALQYGCVNTQVLTDKASLGEPLPVSPKRLDAQQKIDRWKQLWFRRFEVKTKA